jgi:hypothetical protein
MPSLVIIRPLSKKECEIIGYQSLVKQFVGFELVQITRV